MSIPQWFAGNVITADRLNARNTYLVTQEADLEVDGDTGVSTEIVIPVEAGAVYQYWCYISYSATSDSDSALDFWWESPSGCALARFTQSYEETPDSSSVNAGQGVIFRRPANTTRVPAGGTDTTSSLSNYHSAYDQGTITNGSTAGNVVLTVAQNIHGTDDSVATVLRGGNQTRVLYQRIG